MKIFLVVWLSMTALGSLAQTSQIHFRLNLAGYLPDDSKVAVVFSNQSLRGAFNVILAQTGKRVFAGKLIKSGADGFAPFKNFYTLDFSSITGPGNYFIELQQTKTRSAVFVINASAYHTTPDVLIGFMRQQRCGYNPFFDEVCHQKDGRAMGGILQDSTYLDVRGGWHDAGDQLKYLITASNATARMIMAYQLFPAAFQDKVNALGQSGSNGIADVLDEAKWGLDWILKLHPQKDVLIHQVGDDRDHIGWKLPKEDPSNYGWGKNSYRVAYVATGKPQGLGKYKSQATGVSNLAGRSAAALALGHQIWKKNNFDEAFALQSLSAAIELYAMAKQQEGYQQGNSFGAPYRYNEDTWTDDMEWAAAELYRSTGKQEYLEDAKHYAELTGELSWIQNDTTAHYQRYPFLNIAHYALYDLVDDAFKVKLATYYKNGIEQTLNRANKNVYRNGVPFIWCSANLTTDLILQIMLYEKMTNDLNYHSYLVAMRDWLLGKNPWGASLFMNIPSTGLYPKDVHTSTWALTKREVPGGLVDGPIYTKIYQSLKGLTLTHQDAYADFQGNYVVYHDDIGDYSTNEPTMDGTACAIMMMAYFASH
ncbi:MAG: glycoside hydrolase family 9 protein [Bacteroidetes bacterium]|nr:glycoside hydrolase family 9 protein [Bacteroidota bacterium]MBS1980221.1 glycoside hydrolase family 9 protein [Bacteroidota bacterium]